LGANHAPEVLNARLLQSAVVNGPVERLIDDSHFGPELLAAWDRFSAVSYHLNWLFEVLPNFLGLFLSPNDALRTIVLLSVAAVIAVAELSAYVSWRLRLELLIESDKVAVKALQFFAELDGWHAPPRLSRFACLLRRPGGCSYRCLPLAHTLQRQVVALNSRN